MRYHHEYNPITGNLELVRTEREGFDVAVAPAGTVIVFDTPLPDTDYTVLPYCHNAAGQWVACGITVKLNTGFTATPAVNAFLDYNAILN